MHVQTSNQSSGSTPAIEGSSSKVSSITVAWCRCGDFMSPEEWTAPLETPSPIGDGGPPVQVPNTDSGSSDHGQPTAAANVSAMSLA
jgi:hypothetical protein